jgi:hypothetical protein
MGGRHKMVVFRVKCAQPVGATCGRPGGKKSIGDGWLLFV